MTYLDKFKRASRAFAEAFKTAPLGPAVGSRPVGDEQGRRSTPETAIKVMYRGLQLDYELRDVIRTLRSMDKLDTRVKRIHSRVATDTVRGGLVFVNTGKSQTVKRLWDEVARDLQLDRPGKLRSDARLFVLQGTLPLQLVKDGNRIVGAIAMPADTIVPQVTPNGRFKNPAEAYAQLDPYGSTTLATFPLWKLQLARLDPENYDDMGSMGRPLLDAGRASWQKLTMTEEDLVVRRRMRAPLKLSHTLEGATKTELDAYRADVEKNQADLQTDYYSNKKGSVTAVQGDAQMGEIGDVTHLLDTFLSGSPLPKQLLGYADDASRDVLDDLKRMYYDDLDFLQDEQAYVYNQAFQMHLLLHRIDPRDAGYTLKFAERRTETLTQTTDRMLKYQALGYPAEVIFETLGDDPDIIKQRIDDSDIYPGGQGGDMPAKGGKVSITPGNARSGESATDITVRS